MTSCYHYEKDGAAIYAQSFATIRAEADLSGFTQDQAQIVVRMIHASGMVDVAQDVVFGGDLVSVARQTLRGGAPILCDAKMVAQGVTRSRLPAENEVLCLLDAPGIPELARRIGNTRSAAALDLWIGKMGGAIVAIGNAPTALFRLLELLDAGAPKPAAIIGIPVGFVGAVESKQALAAYRLPSGERIPFVTVHGRRGGSAMTAAALNALASEIE
ncbi:Precorrin-8X methylmutase [Granulibacter bethesdensis]|uniref:Precorrin-8X methylmutase n=1 Tax=Granulibacter bethesdensis TaxID=364410 RepID=A0AAC9K8L7_9PROT|nr:precorrin-8X methylmutase [Granulibacter bethesdensis]APH53906.1 Precorrin-8X methylmutase [Granulibacter bethesdensis]APH61484.1 Precorrin-8X methylmutase [Granulibacter bethesdensis]